MRTNLYPYKPGSASAKALAERLGIKRIKHRGSRFRPGPNKTIINWGSSDMPGEYLVHDCRVLNHPHLVHLCSNKREFFAVQSEPVYARLPASTTDQGVAMGWLENGAVVCRTKLQGHSGEGIVIATTEQELVAAPLYTMYIKKKSEWRIHFCGGEVLFIQTKLRRRDCPDEDVNWQVRNHGNGFIYAHNQDVVPPMDVIHQAQLAFERSRLDFGAVDVIFNEHEGQAYVLEINCAPGLHGTTLERYADGIRRLL